MRFFYLPRIFRGGTINKLNKVIVYLTLFRQIPAVLFKACLQKIKIDGKKDSCRKKY